MYNIVKTVEKDGRRVGFEFVYWSDKEGYSLKYDLFRSEDEDEDVLN